LCLSLASGCGNGNKDAASPADSDDTNMHDGATPESPAGDDTPADGEPPKGRKSTLSAPTEAPVGVNCTHTGSGKEYTVGPGQQFEKLADLPWTKFGAGDTVRVFYREEPYREKILLSAQGTKKQPFRFCGVPGPNNELPVLDGDGSVEVQVSWKNDWVGGVILINRTYDSAFEAEPTHIWVEGFEIRGSSDGKKYTNFEGADKTWNVAACIAIWRGDGLVLRGNVLHDCGEGIFAKSSGGDFSLIEDMLVEGNYVYDTGTVGSHFQHAMYVQGARTVYQYNRLGAQKAGASGGAIKDRSPGTIVRYNWIEAGARAIDLVEPQEHWEWVKDLPDYDVAYVYGNIIDRKGIEGVPIHFGGENAPETHRKGPLFFYHNTIYVDAPPSNWRLNMIEVNHPDADIYVDNNVIYRAGGLADSPGMELMLNKGHAHLGVNWFSEKWQDGHDLKGEWTGTLEGREAVISGKNPGISLTTFRPEAGSPLIDHAGPLNALIPKELYPNFQYVEHNQGQPRMVSGKAADLGALEFEGQ
jgi:hypothetical protein